MGYESAKAKALRADLEARFGENDSATGTLIAEAVDCEKEIAGTLRGDKASRLDRRRERRLWMERRDGLMSKLEALRPFLEERNSARADVLMNVDPRRVERARAFLEQHDPTWLNETLPAFLASKSADEVNTFRLVMLEAAYNGRPELADALERFFDTVCDADGNEPAWLSRFLGVTA